MGFKENRRQCEEANGGPLPENRGTAMCALERRLPCAAGSCPSRHYWSAGKQTQIGWYAERALDRTGLHGRFVEDMQGEGA